MGLPRPGEVEPELPAEPAVELPLLSALPDDWGVFKIEPGNFPPGRRMEIGERVEEAVAVGGVLAEAEAVAVGLGLGLAVVVGGGVTGGSGGTYAGISEVCAGATYSGSTVATGAKVIAGGSVASLDDEERLNRKTPAPTTTATSAAKPPPTSRITGRALFFFGRAVPAPCIIGGSGCMAGYGGEPTPTGWPNDGWPMGIWYVLGIMGSKTPGGLPAAPGCPSAAICVKPEFSNCWSCSGGPPGTVPPFCPAPG